MSMKKLRVFKMAMALMLLPVMLIPALASGSFQAQVTSGSMNVYQPSAPHAVLGALPKGTVVTVEAYSGKAALISYNGKKGVARVSDLAAVQTESVAPEAVQAPVAEQTVETVSAEALSDAKKVVTNRSTRVYSQPKKSASYIGIDAGVTLDLLAVNGNVAKVARGGVVGYMPASHLSDGTETAEKTEETVTQFGRIPVATTGNARVYAQAKTSSPSVEVPKGTRMTLLAVKGNCAMVERDGKVGYMRYSSLTTDLESVPAEPVQTAEGTISGSTFTGSNEEIIFKFLTQVAGYNTAAACGILANIKYESGYKPTTRGDSGSSYGIVQWHAERKTRMMNWCRENGYDPDGLKGQLYFLQYELKHYYPSVHNKLKAVENTEKGAYNAGYDFCYNYEAPANRASRSATRANYAKTTLWNRYKA